MRPSGFPALTLAIAAPPQQSPAFAAAKAAIVVCVAELDKAKTPFMEGLVRMKGLKSEIDRRREYLARKLTD